MNVHGCDRLAEVAAELALGLLDGAERAAALVHIERCGDCQAEVAALTGSAEQLLLLTPAVPPPVGFESRVLSRIAAESDRPTPLRSVRDAPTPRQAIPSRRPRRSRLRPSRRLMAAAAAVVVVVAGLVGLLVVGGDDGGDADTTITAAMRNDRGDVVGSVSLVSSQPAVVEIDVAAWIEDLEERDVWPGGAWSLAVEMEDGSWEQYELPLGTSPSEISLDHGDPGGVGLDPDEVVSVAMQDETGQTWCSAEFGS